MTADFEISETIISPPEIDISLNSLTLEILMGTTTDTVLSISNVAQPESQDLIWEIYEQNLDCPWLSESPSSGTIIPGSSQNVDLLIDASQLIAGIYNCNLVISSNDPDEGSLLLPVILNVIGVNHHPVLSQISNQFLMESITQDVSMYASDPDNEDFLFLAVY
jgi:hypothetical protein